MKKLAIAVGVLLMAASLAQAISDGPGGRLYITYKYSDNVASNLVNYQSLLINTDWTINYEGRAAYTYNQHGSLLDNYQYSQHQQVGGISPEVYTAAGNGFATLVTGLNYNNSEVCYSASYQALDILKIGTANGGMTGLPAILSDGRGVPGAHPGWGVDPGNPANTPSTERSFFAAPDIMGGFTGDAQNAFVTHGYSRYEGWYIVSDYHSDGDVADNVEDYEACEYGSDWGGTDGRRDFEILGNKMYGMGADWGVTGGNGFYGWSTAGIGYLQREGDGSLTAHPFFWSTTGGAPGEDNEHIMVPGYGPGVAVTWAGIGAVEIQGRNTIYAPIYAGGTRVIAMLRDINGDGDAMDNEFGEVIGVYDAGSANAGNWDNPATEADIEVVKNADGKLFLLVTQPVEGWHLGKRILVIELLDNGDYVGGNSGVTTILYTKHYKSGVVSGGGDWPSNYDFGTSIEFDAFVIPEPATMLLLGTSALGVLGYLRRRRMR